MIQDRHIKQPTRLKVDAGQPGTLFVWKNGEPYTYIQHQDGTFFVNLPFPGVYKFTQDGKCRVIEAGPIPPVNPPFSLPQPERKRIPGISEIFYDNSNPYTPARINTLTQKVILSPKFFDYPAEIKYFILLHEYGHFFYKTEWKCDQFAAFHYLKTGCNRSAAFAALNDVLHLETPDGTPHRLNQQRVNRIYKLLY